MFEALWRDDRAIEGLPIRLVIALVVGVACLSVMMSTISGMETLQVTEVDVEPEPEVMAPPSAQENVTVSVTVVDPDGGAVAGATVVAKSGTASLSGVATAETNATGTATLTLSPTLEQNQREGTVRFDVKPPAGSNYRDDRSNTALLVVRS
ncbi:carboxypeptidase regulatory-like domain-containing protein [Halomicroarcula sp. GCM10025817]|uniref:DUF7382 domain-containing protein n=1 Tax=Haloarcula TaxID=2237 RepID=UPI0023E78176|nr:carboxypeptidase regulatory-like domain-containing protein [Halomicroarcula sp. SYNS111]